MKAWRWMLIPVGVLVMLLFLCIAIGPIWLNTFIHSEAFKQEVETRAAQSLGGTVQIDSIDFSIFSGVKLHGLVTQMDAAHSGGQGEIAARIEEVNCSYSLWQLLQRKLALTAVTLDKPDIILTRQPPSEVQPPAPANPPATTPTTPGGKAAPFAFVLEALKINDGSLSVRDANGVSLAELHGIQVAAKTAGFEDGRDITGRLKIDQVTLPPNAMITNFSAPFSYRPGVAEVKPFDAAAFNGWLAGDYVLGPSGTSLLDVNAKGVDVAQLAQAVDPSSPGKIKGSLDLQSKWRGIETGQVDGEGDAQLHDGKLEGMPLLHELADALRVKELESPNLKQAQTHFQVTGGRTHFTGLQIDAGIFQMTGDGTIFPGGGLSADMVLIFTRDSMNRIPKEVAMFFVQRQDGSASIAFHLGGTVDRPQTDLATRIFLQATPVRNAINKALDRFFHKHKQSNNPPAPGPEVESPAPAAPSDTTPSGPVAPPTNQ
jgi:uncharacterized protein involved in outer membrane biogenesis